MRCHYVEKRIYLIQTRYVLLQHACQKLEKHVIMLIYCHLSFFTHQTKVGKLGNMWGIIPQKLGKCKVEAQIMNEKVILNNLPRWRDNEKMFAFKHVCMQACLKANRL